MGDFGKYLRSLRKKKGVSMPAFAKDIGTSSGTVSDWENKGRIPRIETLKAISDYFRVDYEELMKLAETASERQVSELNLLRASNIVIARYLLDMMSSYYNRPLKDEIGKTGVQDQFERDIEKQLAILDDAQKAEKRPDDKKQ